MPRYSFSKPVNFAIHVPMLLMNLFVVGGLVWDMTPQTQVKIYEQHSVHVSPVVSLVVTSIATTYGFVLVLLGAFNIIIPVFPRIVIDSVVLWPCHIISVVILGVWNNWSALKQIAAGQVGHPSTSGAPDTAEAGAPPAGADGAEAQASMAAPAPDGESETEKLAARFFGSFTTRELTCTDPNWTTEQCAQRWKSITIVQTIAFAFGLACIILVTIDFILAVRIYKRRKAVRLVGKNPDELDDAASSIAESVQGLTTNRAEQAGGRWVNITRP